MNVRYLLKVSVFRLYFLFSIASASTLLIPVKASIRHSKTVAWSKERLNKLIEEQKEYIIAKKHVNIVWKVCKYKILINLVLARILYVI